MLLLRSPCLSGYFCQAAIIARKHGSEVGSISFMIPEDIVINKLMQLINDLLETIGDDLYRYKGCWGVNTAGQGAEY